MKFIIDRISTNELGIKEAKYEKIRRTIMRGPDWGPNGMGLYLTQEDGERHVTQPIEGTSKVVGQNGHGEDVFTAEYEYYDWTIEINTLEELLDLKEKCGNDLMITDDEGFNKIYIVDDYM